MLEQRIAAKPLPKGLDALCDAAIGLVGRMVPSRQKYLTRAQKIVAMESRFSQLSNKKLQDTVLKTIVLFRCHRDTPSDIDLAFALVREVAFRQIGERPFPVQIAGALALVDGCIAEMATGEGKTLTATMAVTIAGWRGKGCHVITVNDYLAQRDAQWMKDIYKFCGLTVSYIEQETPPDQRQRAYQADITYCTNKEVAADFLRDRIILGRLQGLAPALITGIASGKKITGRLLQRGLHYAIVDEADSILIDEAVTPLIISGQASNPQQNDIYQQATKIARVLRKQTDYTIDDRHREITLTAQGKDHMQKKIAGLKGFWKGTRRAHEMIHQALMAKELYLCDKHYVVADDKITIVDEFTGRLMPDRSWRDGLHQAIEAKENVPITSQKDTYARISFQRFFRMYARLSGMTGTAAEVRGEFWQIYHTPVITIPTHRPCQRKHLPNIVVPTKSDKWQKIVQEIQRTHTSGRPVLIGTRSVRSSEHLSRLLKEKGLAHQVLNATHHTMEAQIVASAGQKGKITVATNMAGRGTDIKLDREVASLGGLHVIAAEPNDSFRVDRQLYGRGARQGDPGSAQGIFSLEEELLIRHVKKITFYIKNKSGPLPEKIPKSPDSREDQPEINPKRKSPSPSSLKKIYPYIVNTLFRLAQRRTESLATRQRKTVLKTDHWLDEQLGFTGRE